MQPKADKQIIKQLVESVRAQKCVHAYLFVGESGLFKRETAYYFATALLCENTAEAPCLKCAGCIQAQNSNNPDIIRLRRTEITSKKTVGVDEIRAVIEDVYTKPFKSDKKVYIIEDGDCLTPAAQNALLKVIEEPPEYAVFIICATDLNKILTTVKSRCVKIQFFAAAAENNVRRYVMEHYPEYMDSIGFIESFAARAVGKADDICNEEFFKMRSEVYSSLEGLLSGKNEMALLDALFTFEKYKKTKDSPDRTADAAEIMLSFLMDMLKYKSGAKIINTDYEEKMGLLLENIGTKKLSDSVEYVLYSERMARANVSGLSALRSAILGIYYN